MKQLLRFFCLLTVVATLAVIPANAQSPTARASDHLAAYRAYCTMNSSTSLTVNFHVIGTRMMDEIGVSLVKVQYSSDQEHWTTVKTLTKDAYPNMTVYNHAAHADMLTCTVPAGYYYRAYVEFYGEKDGSFTERFYYTGTI